MCNVSECRLLNFLKLKTQNHWFQRSTTFVTDLEYLTALPLTVNKYQIYHIFSYCLYRSCIMVVQFVNETYTSLKSIVLVSNFRKFRSWHSETLHTLENRLLVYVIQIIQIMKLNEISIFLNTTTNGKGSKRKYCIFGI